jgi:hypothetical protein
MVLLLLGAVISFAGSLFANYLFIGRPRMALEVQRAYSKLVAKLVRLDSVPSNLDLLPLDISDRVTDLHIALREYNEEFKFDKLVTTAIKQAAERRKEWDEKHLNPR